REAAISSELTMIIASMVGTWAAMKCRDSKGWRGFQASINQGGQNRSQKNCTSPRCNPLRFRLLAADFLPGQALALPVHIVAAIHAVEHAGEHEHQVGQAVEVLAWSVVDRLLIAQRHHRPFGTPRYRAAHVGL